MKSNYILEYLKIIDTELKKYNQELLNILDNEGIEKLKEVLKGSQINSKN